MNEKVYIKNPVATGFFKMLIIVISGLLIVSCSTTKSLQDGELLYVGSEIDIEDKKGFERIGLKSQLKDFKKPDPNKRFLGIIPMKLWIYNMAWDTVPEKGFKHWVKYKVGEAPVIFDYYFSESVENDIQNYLFSKGYFDSRVESQEEIKNQKIKMLYTVESKSRYVLDTIIYPTSDSGPVPTLIDSLKQGSNLKSGKGYDLEILRTERQRISDVLRNKGYYYFTPDYMIFKIDSSYSEKTLDVYLELKPGIPERSLIKQYLNNVSVFADYSLEGDQEDYDTIPADGYKFIYKENFLRPEVLSTAIILKKGNFYRFQDYTATLNKVMGLGVYKFANIRFEEAESRNDTAFLDSEVFLTRTVPKSLRLELQAVSKSNDFAGPGFQAGYRDRNFFRGAENFNLNLTAGFETQIAKDREALNSIQLGVDASLSFPRFIFPFVDLSNVLSKNFTPSTNLRTGYDYYDRTKYFTMNALYFSYGYSWRETKTRAHEFTLLNVDFAKVTNTSAEFDSIFENNLLVRESFEEQFILSIAYRFTYNNQVLNENSILTYFQSATEFAGNSLSLLSGDAPEGERNKFLGIAYAQYARTTADLRFYTKTSNYNQLVFRILAAVGLPYGNSNILPYRKQFYIGGSTSVRAFRYRSVGPGTYLPDSLENNLFFDQTGDIKLESSLEYRFNIYKLLKGALFLDAGNIWLANEDPSKPGGKFEFSDILNETAVGTGFGVRLDASFFVLRLDLGMPLRKPFLPENDRWVIDEINLKRPSWRRDNLVLNIAIGYPF